jgi:Flp pilus assembly protein TadG
MRKGNRKQSEFLNRLGRFFRCERGTLTVEFVIWMAVVFVPLLFLTADVSKLYLAKADMWNVARDTARRMSTGEVTSATAESYAKNELLYYNAGDYVITAKEDAKVCNSGTYNPYNDHVYIAAPIAKVSIFGTLVSLAGLKRDTAKVGAYVTMRSEGSGGSC